MKTGCSGVFMRKIKWTVVVLAIIAVSVIVLCACEGFWGKETGSPEEPSQTLPETPQDPNTGDESGEGSGDGSGEEGSGEGGEEVSDDQGDPSEGGQTPQIYYTIEFLGKDGEIIAQIRVEEGAKIVPPQPKEYEGEGYVFVGWDMPTDIAAHDAQIRAIYEKLHKVTLKITAEGVEIEREFEITNGTLLSAHIDKEGVEELLPEGYCIKGEHAQASWYDRLVQADEEIVIEGEKMVYDVTLYIFEGDVRHLSVEYGQTIELPQVSIKGFLFEGWFEDKACTREYVPGGVYSDTDIYAKMREITSETTIELKTREDTAVLIDNPQAKYIITGEIDFAAIAEAQIEFTGELDGNGYSMTAGNKPLFSVNSGRISGLKITAAADDPQYVDAAFGVICAVNNGEISDIEMSGTIAAKAEPSFATGGICGENCGQISDITFNDFKITVVGGGNATKSMSLGGVFGRGTFRETSVRAIDGTLTIDAQNASRLSACGALGGSVEKGISISDIRLEINLKCAGIAGGLIGQKTGGNASATQITLSGSLSAAMCGKLFGNGGIEDGESIDTQGLVLSSA